MPLTCGYLIGSHTLLKVIGAESEAYKRTSSVLWSSPSIHSIPFIPLSIESMKEDEFPGDSYAPHLLNVSCEHPTDDAHSLAFETLKKLGIITVGIREASPMMPRDTAINTTTFFFCGCILTVSDKIKLLRSCMSQQITRAYRLLIPVIL